MRTENSRLFPAVTNGLIILLLGIIVLCVIGELIVVPKARPNRPVKINASEYFRSARNR